MMPTLYEKASQLIFVRLGSNMQPPVTTEEDVNRLRALLERCPVGGLVLFNGSLEKTPELLQDLQQQSARPLLVASDIERGAGQQITGCTDFPHAMALGRSPEQIEAVARATAREALAMGIHITCMPVADVNRNPKNPIISIRAFGTAPSPVGRCATAYIDGCRGEGLLTAVKHFPGHGNTLGDSHAELPVVEDPREVVLAQDVAPFGESVAAGADLVMTAHVAYPALDPLGRPATLSPPILKDLLREELSFSGAVITDSLLMGGIKGLYDGPGELAAAIVGAGGDILLDPQAPEQMARGIVRAVESGVLPEARLDEAYGRVTALKDKMARRFGRSWASAPIGRLSRSERCRHEALASRVARQAVTVLQAPSEKLFPAADSAGADDLLALLIQPHRSHLDPPEQPLGDALRARFPEIHYEEVGPEPETRRLDELRAAARQAKRILVAVIVRPAAWQSYGLQDTQRRLVEMLVNDHEVILAALGDPGILETFPHAAATLCTYSDTAPSQQALADVLAARQVPR